MANFVSKREKRKKKAYVKINFCSKMLISVLSLFTPNNTRFPQRRRRLVLCACDYFSLFLFLFIYYSASSSSSVSSSS